MRVIKKREKFLESYDCAMKINGEWEFDFFSREAVLKALGEWAKMESVSFLVWVIENGYYTLRGEVELKWVNKNGDHSNPITTDDLYTIFDEDSKTK